MPFYSFRCDNCSLIKKLLLDASERGAPRPCPTCGMSMVRLRPSAIGASKVERLDNGAMSHAVERFSDAERLHHDRAVAHDREIQKGPEIV